jgi:hypothetical protein
VTQVFWPLPMRVAAASQGWDLFEVRRGDGHLYEIQRYDDPADAEQVLGVSIPRLDGDDIAVYKMKMAFWRREPHALHAWRVIKEHSPVEFNHWDMESWL